MAGRLGGGFWWGSVWGLVGLSALSVGRRWEWSALLFELTPLPPDARLTDTPTIITPADPPSS